MTRCEVLTSITVEGAVVRRGEVDIQDDEADRLAALGYVRPISRDGGAVYVAACCEDSGAV